MIRHTLVLVTHSARRMRAFVLGLAVVLGIFQLLLAAMADLLQSQSAFGQIGALVPPAVRQLMGQSLVTMLSVSGVVALGYFHTAVEAALVAMVIVIGSEPAAELDAGFLDLALSRSVPRLVPPLRTMVLLLACPAALVATMGLATAAGARWITSASPGGPTLRLVLSLMVNVWALMMAWGGITLAVAAASRTRSQVTSLVGMAALVTLLVDYLARVWTPARHAAWASPFHYYSPLDLVMGSPLRIGDILTLLGVSLAGAAVACVVFVRRDL